MNRARKIIDLLGGAAEVSRALELGHSTVWRWTKGREHYGTGGHVPRWHHDALLKLAARKRCRQEVAELLRA